MGQAALICALVILIWTGNGDARRQRRHIEVGLVNLADASLRLRCQSVLTDHRDRLLGPQSQFRWKFFDIDRGNQHFWCDIYGLFGLDEQFDVFGREAPSRSNATWFVKDDGLYLDHLGNRVKQWHWNYPPFSTYAED